MSRLSELAVRSLGSTGEGMEAVELAIRTAMTRLGASLLGQLLATPDWLAARLADLGAGDIETLAAETERLHPELPEDIVNDTVKALGYFKTNAHRMRYAYFRERGMFVGSGVVEAGCKSIVGQRLKLSGMRGTSLAPPASSPCAATRPATASTTSGHSHTTRSPPTPSHDQ